MTIAYVCDIILVLILLVAIVNGTRQGFFQTIVGLLLSVITIVLVVAFLNPVRVFLSKYINVSKWVGDTNNVWKNYLLAASNYLIITIIIFLILSIFTAIIMRIAKRRVEDKRIDSPGFEKWDRGLGLVAGLIRGVITCALVSIIISQPLFFPSIQEDVSKTTITSFTYKQTKKLLIKTTGMDDEELTNAMISYLMGSNLSDAKEGTSTYRMTKITAMVLDFNKLMKNPHQFANSTSQEDLTKYIIYISALADITAMSPQNDNLDKQFVKLYDELVSYLPNDLQIPFTEEQFDDMFNPNHGSFYNARLDEERINILRDMSCFEVCYIEG